jgi:hypothetical protein
VKEGKREKFAEGYMGYMVVVVVAVVVVSRQMRGFARCRFAKRSVARPCCFPLIISLTRCLILAADRPSRLAILGVNARTGVSRH